MTVVFSESAMLQRQAVDALERAAKLLREIDAQHPDTRESLRRLWAETVGLKGRVADVMVR